MEDDTLTITIPMGAIEHYGDYDSSPCISDISLSTSTLQNSGTVTIDTSSPTYNGSTITLDDIDIDIDTKRKNLRDEGELPIDIWAKMYNNGVIDDE